jgi:hypothetical protein
MFIDQSGYDRATKETAENLQKVARELASRRLTQLSLPELDEVVGLVSKIVPAGNVPGMILSGLTRISGNQVQPQKARQDINILFKEASLFFERAKYGAVFAGPATVIWAYQNILKLAGKDPESAFPEGIWQFYVDYALRDDTARHASETIGFDTLLAANKIHINDADRLTAWVMATVMCLHNYKSLLASEWYERTALWLLQTATNTDGLYLKWYKEKPYARELEGAELDYPTYRRFKFDQFLKSLMQGIPKSVHDQWELKIKNAVDTSLEGYQKQMSILAYLEPSPFGETRVPFKLEQAQIGVIHNGNYYLLPICEPGTSNPLDVRTARSQVVKILSLPPGEPARLDQLARIRRSELSNLRNKLSSSMQDGLDKLRHAPILINTDGQNASSLSEIRLGERGVGDHALTVIDTGNTFVFDQSHIFFDGAWGAAFAEIMTNEALSWAVYLNMLSPAPTALPQLYSALSFPPSQIDIELIKHAPLVSREACAENNKVDINACLTFRSYINQRSDLLKLTINDLLVLYRAIHADTYQPSKKLQLELEALEKDHPLAASQVRQMLTVSANAKPSILIPIDASRHIPRDRVYPLNMEVPLAELDLLNLHAQTLQALAENETAPTQDEELHIRFDNLQRRYLATLGGFGTISAKAKEIAVQGESASVGAIKLLAHLPAPLKQLLDKVPARYEKLNSIIKGTEVISNLGAISSASSLTRFMSAKDDNDQKQLIWGVMTDANGVMKIVLRDFRPHVGLLYHIGQKALADQIAQDYLDAYAQGLNQYVQEVTRIAVANPRNSRNREIVSL